MNEEEKRAIIVQEIKDEILRDKQKSSLETSLEPKPIPPVAVETLKRPKKPKKPKKSEWDKAWPERKIKKAGKVAVLLLKNGGGTERLVIQTTRGMFDYKGKTYHERDDCYYTFGKKRYPLMILPEYNMTPLGKKDWVDKEMQEKFHILQDHAMNGIRRAERVRMGENLGTKMSGKAMIGIGILLIIVIAVGMQFMKGG